MAETTNELILFWRHRARHWSALQIKFKNFSRGAYSNFTSAMMQSITERNFFAMHRKFSAQKSAGKHTNQCKELECATDAEMESHHEAFPHCFSPIC